MVAAVALFSTVSCNKEEVSNDLPQGGETSPVVFTASVMTKTALGETVDGVTAVNWVSGDAITVNGVEFTTTDEGSSARFTTTESFSTAEVYNAIYPAAAGISHEAVTVPTIQDGTFSSASISVATSTNTSLSFKNLASILKFQVPADAEEVTITSTADLAGTVGVTFDNEGNPVLGAASDASKTITLNGSFVTGTDYYVAVLPGTHQFTVRLDGYLSKHSTTDVVTTRAKISNLKTLPAPVVSSKYGIAGTMQASQWDAANPIAMYVDVNGALVKNVDIYKDDTFKVVVDKSWNESYGNNGGNFTVGKNGRYDVFFNEKDKTITATCVEEYTNVKVQIIVKDEKNLPAVNLHLWKENGDNDENITGEWPGAALSKDAQGNYVYELDGKYIGDQLGYILSNNGADQTNPDYWTATRKGTTFVIAAAAPAKLIFKLDTDNTKQWWGTTTYVHMWTSEGDLFGGWPGKLMTYEGDYTFSCEISGEYVGKTLNYMIHNNNNWKSAEKTLTLEAEQTISGSSININ